MQSGEEGKSEVAEGLLFVVQNNEASDENERQFVMIALKVSRS